jgi:hypothetical protein
LKKWGREGHSGAKFSIRDGIQSRESQQGVIAGDDTRERKGSESGKSQSRGRRSKKGEGNALIQI